MILATISAGYASWHSDRTGSDLPGLYPNSPQKSGCISGPAPIAGPPPNCDGLVQMAIKLEVLIAQAKHARNLRQSKRASLIEAEIRAQRLAIWRVERARR